MNWLRVARGSLAYLFLVELILVDVKVEAIRMLRVGRNVIAEVECTEALTRLFRLWIPIYKCAKLGMLHHIVDPGH
jgi:hypothetical protein